VEKSETSTPKKPKVEEPTASPTIPRKDLHERRQKAVNMLIERLRAPLEEGDHEFEAPVVAEQIEAELLKKFADFSDQNYKSKLTSLCFNLKQNQDLRASVMTGVITPHQLCGMTPQEMASDELKDKRKKVSEYYLQACQAAKPNVAKSTMFKCGKCGGKDTSFFQLQTRSADEPMTTFHNCNLCGHRWRS